MTVMAGMDLGYGSQVQIVRTNYLVVKDDGAATLQQCANFLEAYNLAISRLSFGNHKLLHCDYIAMGANAPSDAAIGKGANVLPLVATSGANVAFGGNHANPKNTGFGGSGTQLLPLHVLSVSGMQFDDATLTAGVTVNPVLADNIVEQVNFALLQDSLGQVADGVHTTGMHPSTLNLDAMFDDLVALLDTGTVNVNGVTEAAFVSAGNTEGTTATTIADYSLGAESVGIVSVVVLAKTSK